MNWNCGHYEMYTEYRIGFDRRDFFWSLKPISLSSKILKLDYSRIYYIICFLVLFVHLKQFYITYNVHNSWQTISLLNKWWTWFFLKKIKIFMYYSSTDWINLVLICGHLLYMNQVYTIPFWSCSETFIRNTLAFFTGQFKTWNNFTL